MAVVQGYIYMVYCSESPFRLSRQAKCSVSRVVHCASQVLDEAQVYKKQSVFNWKRNNELYSSANDYT